MMTHGHANAHNVNTMSIEYPVPSQQPSNTLLPQYQATQDTPTSSFPAPGNHSSEASTTASSGVASPTNTTENPARQAATATTTAASARDDNGQARFTCRPCSFSSKTQKDLNRHTNTRDHQGKIGSHQARRFHCPVPTCEYAAEKDFTRKDNLSRHVREVHKGWFNGE